MKKRQNSLVAFVMGCILIWGYMFPTLITTAEDNYLLGEKKEYEIETIRLNSTEIDFLDELDSFPKLIDTELKVKRSELEQEESWIYNKAKETMIEFLWLLNNNHTVEMQFFSVVSVAMVKWDGESVYPFWQCDAIDEHGEEYLFWIDEMTGRIIAFDIPSSFVIVNGQSIDKMMETIADYYGLTVNPDLGKWYEVNGYDIEVVTDVESIFYFLDEESGRELYLPFLCYGNRLVFNMYRGDISIYDSAKSIS